MADIYFYAYSFILRLFIFTVTASAYESLPPTCPSDIYCHGPLLHTVQMASIYPDSKTFVDMKMKYGRNETLKRFKDMMKETKHMPTRTDVERFINETFDPAGSEFESYEPFDWIQSPSFLEKIADPDLREWAFKLNLLWKFLGRKMKDEVRINEQHYSIIYVPNPVIVPGGRFREFYYWDSYWIVRGLLYSEMTDTVKGMLKNFLTIVDTYGFIPNGGRIYYAMRSQPPLLIPMVQSYLEVTDDRDFLKSNIATLEKEFIFWMTNHTIEVEKDGKLYTLARYKDASSGPRPESYREDTLNAQSFKTEREKEAFYSEIKSAAESGWDFSSRWFILNGTNQGNLTNLKTRSIIPVDLNAIIYWNAKLLAEFYKELDMQDKHSEYLKIAEDWLEAVTKVLWHDEVGAWLDYDIHNEIKRDYFYPTNISPLWTGCYDITKKDYFISKVLKYLDKKKIMYNLGGIPTTLEHSGEQWDYPNAWPPLQYIMIMGLDATGDTWAQEAAYKLSEKWIRSNYKAFNESNAMYEKYDATVVGGHGGGGEYDTQLGFGWTNGVCMELLDKYGDRLTVEDPYSMIAAQMGASATGKAIQQASLTTFAQVLTGLLALIATFAAGCIGILVYKKRHQYVAVDKRKLCPKLCGGYMELKDMAVD